MTTLNTAVGTKIGYNYDALKRLRSRAIYQGSTPLFENRYAYATQSGNQSTALVEFFNYRLASDDGNGDIIVGYQYEYDNGGNITDIKAEVDGALIPLEHYEYEEKQGQLKTAIRYENGEEADRWIYSYDTAGNILSEDHEGSNSELHEYAYEDGRWGDLLTSVDGIDLEYDGSGNPTLYANGTELLWNMEWQNGRQLSRATTERDSTTEDVLDFAYDANGIRTRKTVTRNTYRPVQTYKVTFVADGKTVKTMNVTEGYTLKDSDYPAVPTKSGYSGAWKPYTAAIHNDITINAVYTALKTKHTVIFFADGKALKTMQVDNGYTLKASDYPSIPEKDGYTGRWDTRVTRITKDTAIYAIYSNNSTHTVTFIFAEVERNTLTVADGYILKDSDYPVPLIPSKDPSAVAAWKKYTAPIHEDITVRGNWQGSAVLPTEPSYPDEIMSGGEGEPVEADEPEENGAEPYSAGAMDEADTITHDYLTQSGKVARETIRQSVGGTVLSTKTLDFFYDESGRPFAFNYSVDGSDFETYYYILNLQGDVVQIIDANGVMQAEYIYSPWGEVVSAEGDLAEVNPLRYRGYYYDSETGFYYLQSRYYDPENHRFINADSFASTGQGIVGTNMFAYVNSDPVNCIDADGKTIEYITSLYEDTLPIDSTTKATISLEFVRKIPTLDDITVVIGKGTVIESISLNAEIQGLAYGTPNFGITGTKDNFTLDCGYWGSNFSFDFIGGQATYSKTLTPPNDYTEVRLVVTLDFDPRVIITGAMAIGTAAMAAEVSRGLTGTGLGMERGNQSPLYASGGGMLGAMYRSASRYFRIM